MRHVAWLGIALILFVATLGLTGWADFRDLARQSEWNAVRADASEGELDGLRVRVAEAQAVVVESRPDRGLLLVRLDLEASPGAPSAWVDCRASIRGENGEMWLPLYDPAVSGAVKLLASDEKDNRPCNVSVLGESGRATADQLYRLPRAALERVTLHVSGYGTRPSALAFEVRPTLRTIAPGQ